MSNPIFDYRPQLTSKECRPEPSIRELVNYYYISNGINLKKSNNLTEQYLDDYFDEIFSAIGSN